MPYEAVLGLPVPAVQDHHEMPAEFLSWWKALSEAVGEVHKSATSVIACLYGAEQTLAPRTMRRLLEDACREYGMQYTTIRTQLALYRRAANQGWLHPDASIAQLQMVDSAKLAPSGKMFLLDQAVRCNWTSARLNLRVQSETKKLSELSGAIAVGNVEKINRNDTVSVAKDFHRLGKRMIRNFQKDGVIDPADFQDLVELVNKCDRGGLT